MSSMSTAPAQPASKAPTTTTRAPHVDGTRIRALKYDNPDERHAAILVLTRSFATGNVQNWLAGVKQPGLSAPACTLSQSKVKSQLTREQRNLYYFYSGMLSSSFITGGRVLVVVEPVPPISNGPSVLRDYTVVQNPDVQTSDDVAVKQEAIRVVVMWNAPGAKIDDIGVVIKSKQLRTMSGGTFPWTGWGIRGTLRALSIQGKFVSRHKTACKDAGVVHASCWTLEVLATDPDSEGRGFAGIAIREGLSYIDGIGSPCLLEASEPRPKAIYERFGWKDTATFQSGVGIVRSDGLVPNGSTPSKTSANELIGVTSWTMLRLPPKSM
ncbi:hypothetical protein BKA62DRAFT_699145 [Auriculariales sp. MPI-PUGE-AT-0066]|nr:hypothetical protein BKA62DRAFT_699145 [Auriculariales sp. MPI-PUGE-AT-0066]